MHTYALQLNNNGNKKASQGTNILEVIVRKDLPENFHDLKTLLKKIKEKEIWTGPEGQKKTVRVYNK